MKFKGTQKLVSQIINCVISTSKQLQLNEYSVYGDFKRIENLVAAIRKSIKLDVRQKGDQSSHSELAKNPPHQH